jgi:hypothetical protein
MGCWRFIPLAPHLPQAALANDSPRNMNHRALESNLERLLEHFPREQVMAYYPRRIITPMDYLNPKYFSSLCFRFIHDNQLTGKAPTPQSLQDASDCKTFLAVLVKKMMPTYFLAREFLESVEQTDVLESFTFAQLHFPMPGFLLVLPDQFTMPSVSVNIPFVMVSTFEGLMYIQPFAVADDGKFRSVSLILKYENVQQSIQAYIERSVVHQRQQNSAEYTSDVYIFGLILKLLIILSTQPNALVDSHEDPPARKQRERKYGTIKIDALWNPCFIGKRYSTQRIGADIGCGSGVRMHWRRGHLRNQRYGPGRLVLKPIWIKPVLIHAELLTNYNAVVRTD